MDTGCILIPRANTINRLRATILRALYIAISIGTSVSVVCRRSGHSISSALLVLVIRIIMGTSTILFPIAKTINRLGAALSGALLVSIGIWASKTIVSSIGADGVGSASLVSMLACKVLASAVGSPCSSTINRLGTSLLGALDLVILKWTLLAIERV